MAIAQAIGMSELTLSREIRCDCTPIGKYVWLKADDIAWGERNVAPGATVP